MTPRALPAPAPAGRRPLLVPARLREILACSDLSWETDPALAQAAYLARTFEARLTLYHVVEIPHRMRLLGPEDETDALWPAARRHAWRQLTQWAEASGVEPRVVVERASSAHRALVGYVRAQRPDLVVMARHGRHMLPHLLLGSASEKMLQHGRRPLLCVRGVTPPGWLPYRRLVVPTDFSSASRRAFPLAALLAQRLGARVHALHVAPLAALPNLSGLPLAAEASVPEPASLLAFMASEFEGVALTPHIERGAAWDRIARYADQPGDLVVMATRGLDSVSDRILGSQAERVVRHAACPVLVV